MKKAIVYLLLLTLMLSLSACNSRNEHNVESSIDNSIEESTISTTEDTVQEKESSEIIDPKDNSQEEEKESKQNNSDPVYGDQRAFLSAMAEGIQERINISNRNSDKYENTTVEQLAELYKQLLKCELDRILEYKDAVFEDEIFNIVAHQYIDACQVQLSWCQIYRDVESFDTIWEGGRLIRSGIIVFLYENYNLPIKYEVYTQYLPDETDALDMDNQDEDETSVSDGQTNETENKTPTLKDGVIEIDYTQGENIIFNELGLEIKFEGLIKHGGSYVIGLTFDNITGKELYISMSKLKFDRVAMKNYNGLIDLPDDTYYEAEPNYTFVVHSEDITNKNINSISFNLEILKDSWIGELFSDLEIRIITDITLDE